MAFISIIIPSLNEEKFLPHLLADLKSQTFRDFEVLLVDGHSDDATVAKAQKFKNSLPSLTILNSPKRNVCIQRNLGAKTATTDWLLFLDADDRLPPYFLQGIKYRLDKDNPQIFTNYINYDGSAARNQVIAPVTNAYIDLTKNSANPTPLEACLGFRKAVFKRLGGFDPKITFAEGAELLARARKKKITLKVYKDPRFTYSLRRLKSQGFFNLIQFLSYYQLTQLNVTPPDYKKFKKLYPMKGGTHFNKPINQRTTLEKIMDELVKPRSLKTELEKALSKNPKLKKTLDPIISFLNTQI